MRETEKEKTSGTKTETERGRETPREMHTEEGALGGGRGNRISKKYS